MRVLQVAALAWVALWCTLVPALADRRVALVIGNGAYLRADKLANPLSDARDVRDALKSLGFDVVYGENLGLRAFGLAIGQFADRVVDADVALVYFAGHGATFDGVSYVVPVDAEFASLSGVRHELIAVETLIGDLRQAKGVRIAILDACRDNGAERALKQQASRGFGGVSRGLAPLGNAEGLIIAYATQYGRTAADDDRLGGFSASHSPFTAALLHNIATPGLDVKDMFFKVGNDVTEATQGAQRPEIAVSIYRRYVLAPVADGGGASVAPVPPAPAEEIAWNFVKGSGTSEQLRLFIERYPASAHRGEAEERLGTLGGKNVAVEPAKAGGPVAMIQTPPAAAVAMPSRPVPLAVDEERVLQPQAVFRECGNCPEMVVVPAGAFTMGGSPPGGNVVTWTLPQHVVKIERFAMGRFHVTRNQYAAFTAETGYAPTFGCDWRKPGFIQQGSHPVVCAGWADARAYVDWLAEKTGRPYRLPSDAEFEYAAHGHTSPGTYPRFWFGDDETQACRFANGDDVGCNDGFGRTSPVGSYRPNAFGLFDMAGNAWQWTADCAHDNYNGAPGDGSAWITDCSTPPSAHVARGGSWRSRSAGLAIVSRLEGVGDGSEEEGIRVVRSLTP